MSNIGLGYGKWTHVYVWSRCVNWCLAES